MTHATSRCINAPDCRKKCKNGTSAEHKCIYVLAQHCVTKANKHVLTLPNCPISFSVGSEKHPKRHKLAKMRIQGDTNKFKDLYSVGGQIGKEIIIKNPNQNSKKSPHNPPKNTSKNQTTHFKQHFFLASHQPTTSEYSEVWAL